MDNKTTLKEETMQANVLLIQIMNALNYEYNAGKIEVNVYNQIYEQANQAHKQIRKVLDLVKDEPQEEESRLILYNPTTQKSYRISPKE